MKTKALLILIVLAALGLFAYSTVFAFFSPHLILEKEEGLVGREPIAIETGPKGDVFHLGDTISYLIEVKYDPDRVAEIDKKGLDRNVILEPFEVRDTKEKDLKVDSQTRAYIKEYEIQLIKEQTNYLYSFPTITLRYKLKDSAWFEEMITPQPIFIGARLPYDVTGLGLKPLKGKVRNMDRERIPGALWGVGALCAALGISKIAAIIRKRRKERKGSLKGLEGIEDIFESYKKLDKKASKDPREALHLAYQISRDLLIRKEGIDWLDPKTDRLAYEMKYWFFDLQEKCQKAYQVGEPSDKDVQDALAELEKVFNFYIK